MKLHHWLQQADHSQGPRPKGGSSTALPALTRLLEQKGVPADKAPARAGEVLQALGAQSVAHALQSKNPWQMLKAESTKPGKGIRFLTPEEQGQYIADRAKERYGVGDDTKQKKRHTKADKRSQPNQHRQNWEVAPDTIRLLEGHFKDSQDDAVPQIPLDEVIPDGTGVAVCDEASALRFLAGTANLSTSPLALLVPNHLDLTGNANKGEHIRFAAIYIPTGDPTLLLGTLLQLGDELVSHAPPKAPKTKILEPETAILKVMVFQDELEADWSEFLQAPFKAITAKVPTLQLCRQQGVVLHALGSTLLSMSCWILSSTRSGGAVRLMAPSWPSSESLSWP